MRRFFPPVAFACLVVAAGILHGMRANRWGPDTGIDDAAHRLANVPMEVGSWKGTLQPLETEGFTRFGIKGHLFCQYRNTKTQATLNVLLVCGRTGPISVHTPDVCYEGSGFEAIGAPELKEIDIDGPNDLKFWSLRLRRPAKSVNPSQLEILWAWNPGDGWSAPENPRFVFARHPVLYKLYVIREVLPRGQPNASDFRVDFLREFLPLLNQVIQPGST